MDKLEKYVLLMASLVSFGALFVLNSSAIAAPIIGKEFLMNNVTQNGAMTVLSIFISAFTIPAGQIGSKFGSKKIFIVGCSIFLIGLFVSIFSINSEMFILSRAILGIGYALYFVAITAIIVLAIDQENRGKALGIALAGTYLGCIAAPSLGGYMINNFGWRSVYYLTIPFIIASLFFAFFKIDKEWVSDELSKLDYVGSLLYVIGIILFVYGFSDLGSLFGKIFVLVGVAVLVLFGIYESRIEHYVFNINLFKNSAFAKYNLAGFFEFFAIAVFDVIFSYYFQYVKGWDPQFTGLVLIIQPILLAIVAPIAGRLSDKVHPQKIATGGLVLILISIIILVFLDIATPIYIVIIAFVLMAVGVGLFSAPNTNAVMSTIPEDQASYASAAQLTLRSCGQTLSLGLLTLVCSYVMGDLPLSTEHAGLFVNSLNIIAMVCAVLCLIAIVFSISGIRSQKDAV